MVSENELQGEPRDQEVSVKRVHDNSSDEVLKVSTQSRPSAVAGAIAGVIRARNHVEVHAVGAGASNQAIKAVAIARDYLRLDNIDIAFVPSFIDVVINNEERTAIRLQIESRPSAPKP